MNARGEVDLAGEVVITVKKVSCAEEGGGWGLVGDKAVIHRRYGCKIIASNGYCG